MFKFFRNIRKQLAAENKVAKYLRYSIGEIVLVVIGILIALQINNWNQYQKQLQREEEYYVRLLEDAIQDKEQTENLIELSKARLKASNQAARLLLKEKTSKTEIGIQLGLAIKAIYFNFQPNNSAFEDLKSGANLNIISDKSIINTLNHYFNKVEEKKSIIMVNGEYAVSIAFAHKDNFLNGSHQASMKSGRFLGGMERDVYDAILNIDDPVLTNGMKKRLLNEALEYISVNTRQLGLLNDIMNEIDILIKELRVKCNLTLKD